MPRPRKEQISVADTPYYHIYARCVRRTFLCGVDPATGNDYEHRRQWLVDRIRLLASAFTVDIVSYAIMSNHYHLVVKLNPEQAKNWSANEVITRWTSFHKRPRAIQRYLEGYTLSPADRSFVDGRIRVWHDRLTNISEFMKALNEHIARRANREEACTGHFWEARFKSDGLRTEADLLTCAAYVDLNPIRAGLAETPETSDYTSIQERITGAFDPQKAIAAQLSEQVIEHFTLPIKPLLPFTGSADENGVPYSLDAYLQLVDWTGRQICNNKDRNNKHGHIPYHLAPILERLQLNTADWVRRASEFERFYRDRQRRQCRVPKAA